MHHSFLVFIGAGLGGLLRYWITNGADALLGVDYPYGTLLVNVIGCFMMGLLFVLLFEKFDETHHTLASLLLIGVLGGFTTFSAFSQQTFTLLAKGDITLGLSNIFFSIIFCLLATLLGTLIGKHLI